jgi:dipeptidyl aminopeptidase/acylaminoacyl peptidase
VRYLGGALVCLLLGACAQAPADAGASDQSEAVAAVTPPEAGTDIEGFPGSKIYRPAQTPAPGIVMLHGSEGGSAHYIDGFAQSIVRAGFVVVTLCWYGCPGRPDKILRAPIEPVVDVGHWLKGSPDVAGAKVGLFGWSRGAELSLLVTSLVGADPYEAVAVHAPSDTVVAAFDPATSHQPPSYGVILETDPQTGQMIPAPAWTWRGQPLFGEPKPDFSVPGPTIRVTSYLGPVYVSQGIDDQVWSVQRGRRVVAERDAVPGLVTESHFYPGEGHVLQQPADLNAMSQETASFFHRKLAP